MNMQFLRGVYEDSISGDIISADIKDPETQKSAINDKRDVSKSV